MTEDKEETELSIMKYHKGIVNATRNNPITIIYGGETGCGKSTKIPQFILDDEKENCKIICTEPRKIAAITLAKRVSAERKCDLGSTVGYQIGLDKKCDTENHQTKLLYCTTGVLLEKILYEKGIDQFTYIILDEIHERDAETDLLMMIIRDYLLMRADTKLVLMSATLNIKKFEDYFTLVVDGYNIKPAIVNIELERKFNIEIGYLEDIDGFSISNKIIDYTTPSITTEMYHLAAKIIEEHVNRSAKSILVFLPGIYEIESTHSILGRYESIQDKYMLIIMHSSLPTNQQKEAFMRSTLPKVILSTNIAESSVTIPNVECIIDFCLTKNIVQGESSMSSLKLEFASKNSLIQRAGRTGRTCNGICYRLINKRFYDCNLLVENIPEMQRAPLENIVLRVKQYEYEAPMPMLNKCMSPPNFANIVKAVMKLKELGGLKIVDDTEFFTPVDGELTYMGKVMSNLPLDCQLTKLILFGYMFSVLDEIIIIAAGLSIKSIFQTHYDRKLEDYNLKIRWSNGSGCDSITLLNAYKFWQNEREKGTLRKYEDEQRWCNKYGLDRKNLNEMRLLIFKIQNRLKELQIEPLSGSKAITWTEMEKPIIIKLCLCGAFMPNMFIQGKSDEFNDREVYKTLNGLDPNKTIYFRKWDRDQIGEVYAEQIKEELVKNKIAESTDDIKVSFDFTRVFVQFSDKHSMIDDGKYYENNLRSTAFYSGTICNEVYTAVKYRKTGARNKKLESKANDDDSFNASFEVKVMSAKETRDYAFQYKILDYVKGKLQVKKYLCNLPEHIYCPSFNTKEMVGFITHIEHCNKFYFQPVYECNSGILGDIEIGLGNEKLITAKDLKINKLVIAYHDYYHKRARIVKIYDDLKKVDCFMYDYGYTKEIAFADLYEAEEDVMKEYFLIYERCFECRLVEIAPSFSKCMRGKWTLEAIAEFREQVIREFVKVKIYSFVNEVAAVEVLVGKEDRSINDHMIKTGYARKCEENFMSKMNHNERVNVQYSTNWMSREKEFDDKISNIIKVSIPSPPIHKCKKIIRLEGPYSPLETTLHEVSIESRGLIQIDPTSVNCVLLDHEIENHEGTPVIAADVMKNPSRGVTLYNVTTLPNIYGLSTLIALMFAPNFAFYQDPEKKQFVGVRFGLGCDPNTLKPYYYEHDSYIPINYENVFQTDIADINHLRISMSMLMKGGNRTAVLTDKDKEEAMTDIKKLLIRILSKQRIPVKNKDFSAEKSDLWITNCHKIDVYIMDLFRGGPFPSIMLPSINEHDLLFPLKLT